MNSYGYPIALGDMTDIQGENTSWWACQTRPVGKDQPMRSTNESCSIVTIATYSLSGFNSTEID